MGVASVAGAAGFLISLGTSATRAGRGCCRAMWSDMLLMEICSPQYLQGALLEDAYTRCIALQHEGRRPRASSRFRPAQLPDRNIRTPFIVICKASRTRIIPISRSMAIRPRSRRMR